MSDIVHFFHCPKCGKVKQVTQTVVRALKDGGDGDLLAQSHGDRAEPREAA